MNLREPSDLPDWEEFGRFLSLTILFASNLRSVSVCVDSLNVLRIVKKISPSMEMNIDHTFSTASPNRVFQLTGVETSHVQLDVQKIVIQKSLAKAILSVFGAGSSSDDAPTYETGNIFLRMISGSSTVRLASKHIKQMERTTKKLPPTNIKFRMILSGYDEHQASLDLCKNNPIFRGLVPFPQQGRIFIGFPTFQTTGVPSHMLSHFIPTVSIEHSDFTSSFACISPVGRAGIDRLCGPDSLVLESRASMAWRHIDAQRVRR